MNALQQFYDNIKYFRYLYDPKIIIEDPKFVIKVVSQCSGNIYYYGTYCEPESLKEILILLQDYMYAAGEYELFQFKETNFNIKIIKKS